MNKDRLLKLFNKNQLAEMVLKKDKTIEHLKKREKNISYLGRFFIEGKFYNFYIDKEGEEV